MVITIKLDANAKDDGNGKNVKDNGRHDGNGMNDGNGKYCLRAMLKTMVMLKIRMVKVNIILMIKWY